MCHTWWVRISVDPADGVSLRGRTRRHRGRGAGRRRERAGRQLDRAYQPAAAASTRRPCVSHPLCPASSRWQRVGPAGVGDRGVGVGAVDVGRPVPGEGFVGSDGVVTRCGRPRRARPARGRRGRVRDRAVRTSATRTSATRNSKDDPNTRWVAPFAGARGRSLRSPAAPVLTTRLPERAGAMTRRSAAQPGGLPVGA